jgi:hypothetical protein
MHGMTAFPFSPAFQPETAYRPATGSRGEGVETPARVLLRAGSTRLGV